MVYMKDGYQSKEGASIILQFCNKLYKPNTSMLINTHVRYYSTHYVHACVHYAHAQKPLVFVISIRGDCVAEKAKSQIVQCLF